MGRFKFFLAAICLFVSAQSAAAGNRRHAAGVAPVECKVGDAVFKSGKSSQSFAPIDADDVTELVTEFRSNNAIRRGNARQIMGSSYDGFFEPESLPNVESSAADVILCGS